MFMPMISVINSLSGGSGDDSGGRSDAKGDAHLISWLTAAIGIAALFGLNVGSFLNVVIWRLPRGGSLSEPTWSYCPRCEHRLGALDLVPVLSFLALRARCRYCGSPISWRYPGIELLTGAAVRRRRLALRRGKRRGPGRGPGHRLRLPVRGDPDLRVLH